MADINSSLDRTEEQVRKLESEVVGLEKELEVIPSTVINSDVALSSFFDSTTEQVKNFRNQLKSAGSGTDFSALTDELNTIKRNIADIMSESSKIAIGAFDTSSDNSLKSELNAVVRSFNAVDTGGKAVKETIKSINPELGAIIEKAIYTTDLIETLMGFVTRNDLKMSTTETDLAKGINLGMGGSSEILAGIRQQIDEQKKYIAETYPNGSEGLSNVKSRLVDEFTGAESELDAYNRELEVLSELEKRLTEETEKFAREQEEVNRSLASNSQGDAMSKFKGYFDMYNIAYTTIGKLKQLSDVQDYLSNPFVVAEQSAEQLRANLEELVPKANEVKINDPQTQLNAIENEAEALRNIADRQSELLSSSKYITEETKNRLTSEEQLNALIAQRQQFNTEQLGLASRLANMQNLDEASKILDLSRTADSNTFNAYMTQIEEAVREVQTLRENLLKAQNTMNSTNVGTSPFTNIINSADVEKLEKFQQLFNNGLKINAEGSDLNYIKQLGMYLDSVREIAKNFKSELGPEVAARFQMFSNLRSVENEGSRFNNSSTNITQEYINRARLIGQITKELETLNNNKDKITQNLDLTGYKEYEKLVEYLTSKLNQLKAKQEEVHDKMVSFGMQIPNTDNVRTTNDFAYSRNIHSTDENGRVTYDYKNTVGNIEGILKGFDQETEESKKKLQELQNKVADVFNSIKKAISNVISVIRMANNVLHTVATTIVSVFNGALHTIQRIIQLFGNLGDRIGLTNRHTNILKGSFTELKSAIELLAGAFNKVFNNQFIQQGRKLLGSIQTLKMLMGNQLTDATIEWANKMESAFGLSAGELISNLREVTAVMYGLGMSAKDVQVGARNLESVGMVLSSISGLDFDTVMTKIQSGMKGMTQAIDDLGLSVRESQMDAYLKKLKAQGGEFANIATSFSQLNEQQRVYVRYAAIMDQFMTKEAYTVENYAKSLRTTTGSIGVLISQLNGLKSALGTLALGLFSKILQPLIYIVYYVTLLIKRLGEFLGIKMQLDSNMNGGGDVDPSPIEDETKALDDMADAANKAKGSLDELDHVTSMSSSSGSSKAGASDFDYSSLLVGDDSFADKLAEVTDNFIEECKQKLIQMLKDAEQAISNFIREQTGRLIDWDELENNLKQIGYNIKATFMGLVQVAKNVFKIIGGLVWSIGDDLNFSSLFEKFTRNIANTVSTINLILDRIAPYIQQFYDKYLSKYVIKFGEWLDGKLDLWAEKIHTVTTEWLKMTPEDLSSKVDELGTKFENLLTTLKEISIIFKTLFGKDTEADNTFMNENASDNMLRIQGIAETLNETFSALWDIIKKVAHSLADLNGDGDVNAEDLGVALDWIKEKLDKIKEWLTENKDEISTLLTNAAQTVGKLAEAKFDLLMGLLQFITDHADLVNTVLNSLKELIDLAVKHPVLTFTAAVGIQVAGHLIKTAITAAIWKSILGLGTGGGLITAVGSIWSKITAPIATLASRIGLAIRGGITNAITNTNWSAVSSSIVNGLKSAGLVAAIAGLIVGGVEAAKVFVEDSIGKDGNKIKNDAGDLWSWITGGVENTSMASGDLQKIADKYYKVLRDNFGYEIPKQAIDNAVEIARRQLTESGKYTVEQIDRMTAIIEEDIYEDIEHPIHNLANTGDWDAITNKVTVVEREMATLDEVWGSATDSMKSNIVSLDAVIGEETDTSKVSLDELIGAMDSGKVHVSDFADTSEKEVVSLDSVIGEKTVSINKNIDNIGSTVENKAQTFNTHVGLMTQKFGIFGATVETIATAVSSSFGTIINKFKELFDNNNLEKLDNAANSFSKLNSTVGVGLSGKTGTNTTKVRNFYGHANGGIPSTGSLFLANENGNAELVGNFGGYTGVANNTMIMKAMSGAVYDAVSAALQNNNSGGNTIIEVCKGGIFVGDDSTIRQLANMLNNVNATSKNSIANTSFVMK